MKHLPFRSNYRQDFQVVEERRGKVTLFPHTEQLPLLWRALNFEFAHPLPDRVVRTDHRGDAHRKLMLRDAVHLFCNHVNRDRPDDVRLFKYKTPELVSKVAIVQHIKESTPQGLAHRFRFYVGTDFVPDLHLNGHRIVFAGHVFERFSKRVPHRVGEDLRDLLLAFTGSCMFSMPIGAGRAFVVPYFNSLLAFTFKETPEEYFITTCLSVCELNGLVLEDPVQVAYLHYGPDFTAPTDTRNWLAQPPAEKLYRIWKEQITIQRNDAPPTAEDTWQAYATRIRRVTELDHPAGSRMEFLHQIYGPATVIVSPRTAPNANAAPPARKTELGRAVTEETSTSERVAKRFGTR